ncbi:MAG: NAD(P)-binding domain-containing protein, partial [Bacteroidales bacterium]
MQKSIKNIAFAGSGNVAWHLAQAFHSQGFSISGIWSRDYSKAQALALACNSMAFDDISGLRQNSDLIVIAVPDNAIEEIAS